jgi:membrane associated rhomboid family serine protease
MLPLRDSPRTSSFPLVNWLLIGANFAVFVGELSAGRAGRERLIATWGLIPAAFVHHFDLHAAATLITSQFIHAGWLHILGNMLALYIFGDNVEDRLGPVRYLFYYLIGGVVAALVQIFLNSDVTLPTIGASGAIACVLGGYIVLYPRARVLTLFIIVIFPLFLEIPAIVYLGLWFLLQLISGTYTVIVAAQSLGGVAWWAHVGGFTFGALTIKLFGLGVSPARRGVPEIRTMNEER